LSEQEPDWSACLTFDGFSDDVFDCSIFSDDEVVYVELEVIGKRVRCPRLPREDPIYCMYDKGKLVTFDTLEEAEELVRTTDECSNSWLCRHMSLDSWTAKRIHEYVSSYRPCPVFFFEMSSI
jgi:hypothetical protein